jgi:hypothetical protein
MRLKRSVVMALAVLALLQFASWTQMTEFEPSSYHILSLGSTTVDVGSLIQTAHASAFSVALYTGSTYTVYREGVTIQTTLVDVLSDPKTLVVDGDRFRLRVVDAAYSYTVRPSEFGYELVIAPAAHIPIVDTLQTILPSLQDLGIVGADVSMDFRVFDRSSIKGPPPPQGAAIDSVLYDLVIAEDWFAEAAASGITMAGLRVEVVAEKMPGAQIPEGFAMYIASETENITKLLMPVEQLVLLARSEGIGYIRLPYQPAVP